MNENFDTEELDELEDIEEKIKNSNLDEEDDDDDDNFPEKKLNKGIIIGIAVAVVAALGIAGFFLFNNGPYTVKFDTDGGNKIESQKIKKGDTVKEPEEPIKPGNEFLGWYVGNQKYDFSKKVKSSFTLKAKWENNNTADVEGVELDQYEVALLPGDTMPLIVNVLPADAKDQTVKWSSSDDSIVEVDEFGNIKAIAIGSATVTVITNEGGFEAKCRVVVSNNVVKVTGIEVDQESLELASGEKVKIKTTISPNNATNSGVIWKSDDQKVATVTSSGVITAVGKGSTTVSVTTKDGGFEKRIDVSVDEIDLKSISIPSELSIQIGKTEKLDVTFTPKNVSNKEVEWSSEDDKIVSVDENGKITAKKLGSTKVTVKTKEGDKKATCRVTVTEKEEINVMLDKTELSMEEGQAELLTASVTPVDESTKGIAWSSSDKSVATINNGIVTAVGDGTATITVTSIVDRSKSATCVVHVKGLPKTYTFTIEEVKSTSNIASNNSNSNSNHSDNTSNHKSNISNHNSNSNSNTDNNKEEITYKVKVFENDKDVTSKVTKISGIKIKTLGSTIILSEEEGKKIASKIDVTVNGKEVEANKK